MKLNTDLQCDRFTKMINRFSLKSVLIAAFVLTATTSPIAGNTKPNTSPLFENGYAEIATKELNERCENDRSVVFEYWEGEHFNPYSYALVVRKIDTKYSGVLVAKYNDSFITGKRVNSLLDTTLISSVDIQNFQPLISAFGNYKLDSTTLIQHDGASYGFRLCNQSNPIPNREIGFGEIKPGARNQRVFCGILHNFISKLLTKSRISNNLNVCKLNPE